MSDVFMRISDVVEFLNISRATFYRMREAGVFPKAEYLAGTSIKVWRRSALERWMETGGSGS